MTVHIFQIGCTDLGRHGFEKLVDKEKFFPEKITLEAVCEKDFEYKESAKKFASTSNTEVDFYDSVDKLYEKAKKVEGTVLIYDAGPIRKHANHIERSLRNNFYHLSEKPPSTTRQKHIEERKLAAKHDVHYKVDFLERENPAFKKTKKILKDSQIESIKVFRQSSTGVQRILQPVEKAHVNEGCTLDELIHDIYITDLANFNNLAVNSVKNITFMPRNIGSEKLLRIDGGTTTQISKENSLGTVSAQASSENIEIELNASWLGLTDSAKLWDQKIREKFGRKLVSSKYRELDEKSFLDEEARFFVINGERNIVCDLLNFKIYDIEHNKEIEADIYPRDQLYRVLEKAIIDAKEGSIEGFEVDSLDSFMNALFDIQQIAGNKERDIFDELDAASDQIRSMIVTDKDELDKDELKGVAS